MNDTKISGKVSPQDVFSVSDEVNYLEPSQLAGFEKSFLQWKNAASRADSVRARGRMWLLFLLLRHSGARLGEVLALDDSCAFESEGSVVCFGRADRVRRVPLPDDLFSEITEALESPMGCGLRGQFFHVDPGYFRRICYARGRECGLPKALACPRALRNTRAVELLRGGVPITVVKEILGQSSLNLTAGFQQFSQGEAASIVRTAQQAMCKQTSARNAFVGTVIDVERDSIMSQVVMETRTGVRISAVITTESQRNLKIVPGSPVIATIKAPLVNVLSCDGLPAGSARNRLRATVLRATHSPVLSEVIGRLDDGTEVCALISAESTKNLALESGDEVEFWFKALSVVLNTVQL
ncbi:TOBE domain-containing protein [uncultured Pseudodesulfovibrio sp.]|uniref:TOBE domain-containing protein n=1 Tax=uncultured Pseudodesulfovibrio sp. TaxID=2035858 RepID=UPI0029C91490|nr:TOBE domain-containing protein [uncultured Pseudodesulfovibrio sp.]